MGNEDQQARSQKEQEHVDLINQELDSVEQGSAADKFLRSTATGRYLVECAVEQQEIAFKEFLETDPKDAIAILEVQNKGLAPKLVIAFLADAIKRGTDASEYIASELEGMYDE